MVNGAASTAPTNGFYSSIRASAVTMNNCHWGTNSAVDFVNGFHIHGTHWHNCIVENCHIVGSTAALLVDAECIRGDGSEFRNCYLGSGYEAATDALHDNQVAGNIVYRDCRITVAPKIINLTILRSIGNVLGSEAGFDATAAG